ncbi:leucine-rich repeat protein 1 [Coccinella septempunctata]|uniref:leucine-rich repeat protein 1 n=1 Tax=Coccinella septempunctata TaxID=41139 RepID=UPI001D06F268|nr:leucine-rich repeat protein 1 [Coccinella septempunctata]
MKLPCALTILDRSLSSHGKKSNKPVNSTIAICKHPKADKHCLIVFNAKNANGTKYDVNGNIQKLHTKFLNEGKVTIQFKHPPHDIYIQATVILLKSFLSILHGVITGTSKTKDSRVLSLSVNVTAKFVAPTKLVIKSRSEYPFKGFPPTLENLTIEGIRRCGLDLGILRLTKLKVLNISDNNISTIPEEFSLMKNLKVLDISKNHFHQSSSRDWRWLSGNLCDTLVSLNMASNKLKFLTVYIIKLRNLHSLDVSDNQLKEIPNGIGCLRKLKSLRVHSNFLDRLPGSIKCLRLVDLNVSNNRFESSDQESFVNQIPISKTILAASLKELAAQKVLELGFKYDASIIPATLVFYLDSDAKYCPCGKPCFNVYSYKCNNLNLSTISDAVITNPLGGLIIKTDCYFCSHKCARIYNVNRVPLVR